MPLLIVRDGEKLEHPLSLDGGDWLRLSSLGWLPLNGGDWLRPRRVPPLLLVVCRFSILGLFGSLLAVSMRNTFTSSAPSAPHLLSASAAPSRADCTPTETRSTLLSSSLQGGNGSSPSLRNSPPILGLVYKIAELRARSCKFWEFNTWI